MSGSETPDTTLDAYERTREEGEDVNLRRQVGELIAEESRTTNELVRALDGRSANAIRPRVNELLRMGCIEREGKRQNPSGHDAYVHHITETGEKYLDGSVEPELPPRLSQLQADVVDMARRFVRGQVDEDVLHLAVERHDDLKRRMRPEWDPGDGDE